MEELKLLVVRAQTGDLDAFGRLVDRFRDMAYGYAFSMLGDFCLAEDAAQDAFVQAYRKLSDLREPEAFAGWLKRIVFTACNRLTRGKRIATEPLEAAAEIASDAPGPAELAEQKEMRERVLEAVRALPEDERVVTTLFYINDYSHNEIAEFLEVPATTVKSRLHTSRARLKERMIEMVAEGLQANKPGAEFTKQLFNGISLEKWGISKEAVYEVHEGEIIVDGAKGGKLHAEVGGMSWDDYRVAMEVLVEVASGFGEPSFNVEWCPNGTSVYCQLVPGAVLIAYFDDRPESVKGFTHLACVDRKVALNVWHRFEALVADRGAAVFVYGEEVARSQVPRGTSGMLGLVVACGENTRVRLRNLQISFLKPTPQQLEELETDAMTNWEDFKRRDVEAGRRKSTADDSLDWA
jgi:RNA polymerase sigma factor (sigma-70 family)